MRLNNYSFNYRFPKLTLTNCNYMNILTTENNIFVDMENFAGSWKHFRGYVYACSTCMHAALMGVARCIYGNCFLGKYFVVCFSTTKNTNILLPQNTHYMVLY